MLVVRRLLLAVLCLSLTGCTGASDPASIPIASPSASASPSTAAPTSSPSASTSPVASSASPASAAAAVRLTGDGIDLPAALVEFGTTFGAAEPRLRAALGRPTRDTGVENSFSSYGTCPGTKLRALEYAGGALWVLFGDVQRDNGPLTMYQWALTPKGRPRTVPRASALVGDVSTLEFGIGTTVQQLRDGASTGMLTLSEGDEVFGPSFSLRDQSSGFFGNLTDTKDTGTVTFVQAGMACGE